MNKKQQNLAQYPKTQNPNQGFEQKIHNMVKTKKHPKLKLKISTKMLKVKSLAWSPNENRPKQGGYTIKLVQLFYNYLKTHLKNNSSKR